jgi:hypothetical protein
MLVDWLLLALTNLWAVFCVSLGVPSQMTTTWSNLNYRKPSRRHLAEAPTTCMANRQVDEGFRKPAVLTSRPKLALFA